MSAFAISNLRMPKQPRCQCGALICCGDLRETDTGAEIICSGCHATILDFELHQIDTEEEEWD